jgi:hypothetical protein
VRDNGGPVAPQAKQLRVTVSTRWEAAWALIDITAQRRGSQPPLRVPCPGRRMHHHG